MKRHPVKGRVGVYQAGENVVAVVAGDICRQGDDLSDASGESRGHQCAFKSVVEGELNMMEADSQVAEISSGMIVILVYGVCVYPVV